jgi:hypothetical protein
VADFHIREGEAAYRDVVGLDAEDVRGVRAIEHRTRLAEDGEGLVHDNRGLAINAAGDHDAIAGLCRANGIADRLRARGLRQRQEQRIADPSLRSG